jgi:hypothetical protein
MCPTFCLAHELISFANEFSFSYSNIGIVAGGVDNLANDIKSIHVLQKI